MAKRKLKRRKVADQKPALDSKQLTKSADGVGASVGVDHQALAEAAPQPVANTAATPIQPQETRTAGEKAPPASPTSKPEMPSRQPAASEAMAAPTSPGVDQKNIPDAAPLDLDRLASAAWRKEMRGLEEDKKEVESLLSEVKSRVERATAFRDVMNSVISLAAPKLAESVNIVNELPPDLRVELQGRQQGLTLTGKMLARLSARLPQELEVRTQELPSLGEARWRELLTGITEEQSVRAKVNHELAEIAARRYGEVTRLREAAGKLRKATLGFVEKEVLPILDALDDGEKYSTPVAAKMKEQHPGEAERLDTWCSTFRVLRGELSRALDQVGVRRIEVSVGAPILYDRHQPFDIEPDPTLPDEHIKALVRNGYEYLAEAGEACVLRAAQVVAMKNAGMVSQPKPEQAAQKPSDEPASPEIGGRTS